MIKKITRQLAFDRDLVLADARKEIARRLEQPARRSFLRRSLTLGGLSLLSGCAITDENSVETALMQVSRFNDKVQGWLFDPRHLAPTYTADMITRPFPFNAYYALDDAPTKRALFLELYGLFVGCSGASLDVVKAKVSSKHHAAAEREPADSEENSASASEGGCVRACVFE